MRTRSGDGTPLVYIPFRALGLYRHRNGCVYDQPPPKIPKPLKPRKRDLSPSFEGHHEPTRELTRSRWRLSSRPKTAQSQSQSLLLSLPPELQAQIWKECLGGSTFNFDIENARLQRELSPGCIELLIGKQFLSLPLTCRLMYLHTIHILYGENTFYLQSNHCLLYIDRVLLPQRINTIKYLHYRLFDSGVPLKDSPESVQWHKVWKILASLEGLSNLRVDINTIPLYYRVWRYHEASLLECTQTVTRPSTFNLYLPWPQGDVPLQLSCTVHRPAVSDVYREF